MKNDTENNSLTIRVDCYSGHRADETPRRFYIGNQCIEIREIQDRWIGPDHRYFKIVGDDNATYILRHDTVSLCWELIPPPGRLKAANARRLRIDQCSEGVCNPRRIDGYFDC